MSCRKIFSLLGVCHLSTGIDFYIAYFLASVFTVPTHGNDTFSLSHTGIYDSAVKTSEKCSFTIFNSYSCAILPYFVTVNARFICLLHVEYAFHTTFPVNILRSHNQLRDKYSTCVRLSPHYSYHQRRLLSFALSMQTATHTYTEYSHIHILALMIWCREWRSEYPIEMRNGNNYTRNVYPVRVVNEQETWLTGVSHSSK